MINWCNIFTLHSLALMSVCQSIKELHAAKNLKLQIAIREKEYEMTFL